MVDTEHCHRSLALVDPIQDAVAPSACAVDAGQVVAQLSADAPPFGLAIRAWHLIVERATALFDAFDTGAEQDVIAAAADELRSACRPYV
mgnify:CR=1 FL=1